MKNDMHAAAERRATITLLIIVVAVLIASLFYRFLAARQLEHTSLVFIGIPALVAILVALLPRPQTATGMIFKALTLVLLISGVAFGEAFVCILFAAPLFYLVGAVVGLLIDRRRHRPPAGMDFRAVFFLGIVLMPASLEGVLPGFEFERDERVTVVRIVNAPAGEVADMLARIPHFERPLPLFLRLGFPQPGETSGAGLKVGDVRRIQFLHGHHPGSLTLVVERHEPGQIVFNATADDSYITHWLSWHTADVRWREVATSRTEVSWTLSYRRRLDPAWYFRPLERYGAAKAAEYLIDSLATPRSE